MDDCAPQIDKVLFPVDLSPVFIEQERGQDYCSIPGFKAVVAQDDGHVFSVVSRNYRLITNQEALNLAEICFEQVFNLLEIADMEVFNIVMPKTRSYCHVDFVHPEASYNYFENDPWTPFLRVTNSYNRMFALNFDIGFCRGICKNGIIFGKKNIEFKFHHTYRAKNPIVEFKLASGEFATLEAQFIESLKNLKRFHVPRNVMWALVCKVFGFNPPTEGNKQQQDKFSEREEHVQKLRDHYFQEQGENGYAAMNVLTDFATRPVGVISAEGRVNALQRKSGAWVADFVEAIEARSFNFESYLGEYAMLVA